MAGKFPQHRKSLIITGLGLMRVHACCEIQRSIMRGTAYVSRPHAAPQGGPCDYAGGDTCSLCSIYNIIPVLHKMQITRSSAQL